MPFVRTMAGDVNTQFAYNGDGIRLQLDEAGTLTSYAQDYASPLPVVLQAETGGAATQYARSLGTRPLAEYDSAAWEYLLPDPLGSVPQIADESGSVTLLKSYEPYGTVLDSQGSATSDFGYAGEQTDSTGLVYLRARYYQTLLGLFLSRDAWLGDPMEPGSMNSWLYADANPIIYTDSAGNRPCCRPGPVIEIYEVFGVGAIGLALRTGPYILSDPNANIVTRLLNGTPVQAISRDRITNPGNNSYTWRYVAVRNTLTKGFVADMYLRTLGGDAQPTPAPTPGGGSPPPGPAVPLTQLPVDNPSYDNGYGTYWWDFHDGYDITSQTGNRTVYSMGAGVVDSMDTPNLPGVTCSCPAPSPQWYLIRIRMDAGYYIKYVHIKATGLCIGDRVESGTVLGEYDEIPPENSDYPHVHVGFESPKYQHINPADYWPSGAPTAFKFGDPLP